jgi:hypothetical protein
MDGTMRFVAQRAIFADGRMIELYGTAKLGMTCDAQFVQGVTFELAG